MIADDAEIARWLAARQPIYRYRRPRYQVQLLKDLAVLMPAGPCRVLDIGAGSGLVGAAVNALFPGKSVTGVDIERRFLPGLEIPFVSFDGRHLPFADAAFDCALMCNVLHHVKPAVRPGLLREALRVTAGGPLLIKDHIADTALDRARLTWLDLVGNLPFHGMVAADYLGDRDWRELFAGLGCSVEALAAGAYREGLPARLFPNRLEVCLRIAQSPFSQARSSSP